jgi:heparin/heparan-sulfate lyase
MDHPVLKPLWGELQTLAKKNPQTRLELDAMRFLLDRDEELGRRTAAESLHLIQQMKVSGAKQDSSRKIGRMMVTTAIVYDWCHPVLTADQKEAFYTELVRLAKGLECGYPPDKGSFIVGHPSEWMILRDLLSAGVSTYGDNSEMYRLAAGRIFRSHLPARNWWYPGGAFHQGPGYADARFVSDLYATWIFGRMGAGKVFDPAQQYVPYEWLYLRRPDGQFVRSGDGQNWPTRVGTLMCASFYHDGYLLSDYLRSPPVNHSVEDARLANDARMDDLFEFLWRDIDLKPLPLADLPLSRYFGFPYGWMVARTGWGADSVIAQMKVNIYNLAGHQHNDGGTFEIYHDGPLAIHSGVYQGINGGYNSPHHANYYKRTIAHNSLLIYDPNEKFSAGGKQLGNDGGQRLPNGWREPRTLDEVLAGTYETGKVLGESFGPDPKLPLYTYLKGDLTKAYSSKVREVKRSFVFLNFPGDAAPGALVVFDRVVSTDPSFQKFWLLQSVEEPVVEGNTSVVSPVRNGWTGKLVNTSLLPGTDNPRIAKVGGPGKEFWVFGKNYPNETEPPDPEVGGWRVELSPTQPSATDLFLNVIQITDRSQSQNRAVEKVESGQLLGARLADRLVLFNSSGNRTAQPFSFTARGQGTIRFLIADLAAGSWQVMRDGAVEHASLNVTAEAGTLYFEGPAGIYSLHQ